MRLRNWIFYSAAACGVLAIYGCSALTPKTATSIDTARSDDLPAKLKDNRKSDPDGLLGKASAVDNSDVQSPLQKQLTQLQQQAQDQRQALSQNHNKSIEIDRRNKELHSTLQQTEARIAKIEKVILLIDENPQAIDALPLNAGSTLAMNGGGNQHNDFRDDDMPSLDANWANNSTPARSASPAATAPTNDWISDNSPSLFVPKNSEKRGGKNLMPDLETDGAIWSTPPAVKTELPLRVLLCDGDDASATYIISKNSATPLKEGMLLKADAQNILIVTKVYAANAEARLHPSFAAGGVQVDTPLTPLAALPQ